MNDQERASLHGKRLMALDFGMRRIGVAVSDELHILVSTRPVLENTPEVLENLSKLVERERCDALLIGVPRHHDDRTTPIIEAAEAFLVRVRAALPIPVYEVDEAFSTQQARARMIGSGVKQKRRRQKGVKDQFAAAVILENVLEELRSSIPIGRPE